MIAFGPVLYFRGADEDAWRLKALIGVPGPGAVAPQPLSVGTEQVQPALLAERAEGRLWVYDFALPLGDADSRASYRIGNQAWDVHVPARGGRSLRIAFTACNGSEQGDAWGETERRNERWIHLGSRHEAEGFHLLLQGGDQLYADPIWGEVPELAAWRKLPTRRRLAAKFTPTMAEAVDRFYFDQYCRVWGQPELRPLLARVPSLMLWDDHDIIDGWGSYPKKWHDAPVLQCIWRHAREHFALFQLASQPDELPEMFCDRGGGHFGWAVRIGDVGIIAPDLRSERSRKIILGEAGWRDFCAALEKLAGCRHVLLVFTVPLVNAQLPRMERLFASVPGHQSWEDDLVDQWPSLAHREEWLRMLRHLTGFSARTGARLTSLSGEVHLGALGEIEGSGARILQLTASGIVHPPPNRLMVAMVERASRHDLETGPGLAVRALPMPGSQKRYLAKRNWLELDLQPEGAFRAAWHPEEGEPIVLAVEAASAPGSGPS